MGLFKFFSVMIALRVSVGPPLFCFNISTMLANISRELQFGKQRSMMKSEFGLDWGRGWGAWIVGHCNALPF